MREQVFLSPFEVIFTYGFIKIMFLMWSPVIFLSLVIYMGDKLLWKRN